MFLTITALYKFTYLLTNKVFTEITLIVQQPNPISGLDVVLEYKVLFNADY